MFAARNARGVRYDAASELTAALTGGALTPDNFTDALRNALVKQITTATGPGGAALWQAAEAVERVAENQVRQWLGIEFDSFLDHFGEQFDQAAEALAKALPLALNPGATPQEILKGGQKAIDAAARVAEAEAELNRLYSFLQTVANEAEVPLPFARFVDSGDDPLPAETGVWASYLRQGYKVGVISEDRAAAIAAKTARLALEAEAEEWRPRIYAEAQRLAEIRERGLNPPWVLKVPAAFQDIADEAAEEFRLGPRSSPRRNVAVL
jgi:hypothetical protein